MTSTVHALLFTPEGQVTDLNLDVNDTPAQRTQLHEALAGRPDILTNIHSSFGPATTLLANETDTDLAPNETATKVIEHLLNATFTEPARGPVIAIGMRRDGSFTDLPTHIATKIRTHTTA